MINGDTEELDGNLTGWKLISVAPKELEIELDFRDPIEVSQGDNPD